MLILRTVLWKIRQWLPDWGPVRWTVLVLAVLVLLLTGISLFRTPAYEITYSSRWMAMPAGDGRNAVMCTIEVGNTGRMPQENVRIHFLRSVLDHAVVPPSARNFGVTDRPLNVSRAGARATLELGPLDPEKRVTVSAIFIYMAADSVPPWHAAFRGMEPARGKAQIGDPGLTAAGRGVFSAFVNWLPF